MNANKIYRGDILYADLSPVVGSEEDGFRPVLVIQNNAGNKYSPTVIIAPISSQIKKTELPTHVLLPSHLALPEKSMVMLEQIRTLDKDRLDGYIDTVDDSTMRSVNKAIKVSLGLIPQKTPSNSDALTLCLCPTCASYFYRSRDYFIRRADPLCRTKEACDYCRLRQGYDFNIYRFTERKSSTMRNKDQKSPGHKKEGVDINV